MTAIKKTISFQAFNQEKMIGVALIIFTFASVQCMSVREIETDGKGDVKQLALAENDVHQIVSAANDVHQIVSAGNDVHQIVSAGNERCDQRTCNAGVCSIVKNNMSCDCTGTGFTGDRCQHDLDECAVKNRCVNGKCVNTIGSSLCNCFEGFTGETCTIRRDDVHRIASAGKDICQNLSAEKDIRQKSAGKGFPKGEMSGCSQPTGRCYYVSDAGHFTFRQAAEICAALTKTGQGLFTLPMPRDNCTNIRASNRAKGGQYWLGIGNKRNKDHWHYDTPADRSSGLKFFSFYKDKNFQEPNGGHKGLCVFATHVGAWFDTFCTTTQQRVLCEHKKQN